MHRSHNVRMLFEHLSKSLQVRAVCLFKRNLMAKNLLDSSNDVSF